MKRKSDKKTRPGGIERLNNKAISDDNDEAPSAQGGATGPGW